MKWLLRMLGLIKDERAMSQSQEKIEQRAMTDRLIEEHRRANAAAFEHLKREAPLSASRYLNAMDMAMTIMKGE
ncbi:hypothetical protein MAUB1S_11483 [Mycolicibacterium aubagnense]